MIVTPSAPTVTIAPTDSPSPSGPPIAVGWHRIEVPRTTCAFALPPEWTALTQDDLARTGYVEALRQQLSGVLGSTLATDGLDRAVLALRDNPKDRVRAFDQREPLTSLDVGLDAGGLSRNSGSLRLWGDGVVATNPALAGAPVEIPPMPYGEAAVITVDKVPASIGIGSFYVYGLPSGQDVWVLEFVGIGDTSPWVAISRTWETLPCG